MKLKPLLQPFPANGNIFESGQTITEEEHKKLRLKAEAKLQEVFEIMLVEMDDNTRETAKRIVKVWMGDGISCDTELGGGRFSLPVRLPKFPNDAGRREWITKKVRLVSTCSHHFLPFTGWAEISYKPNKFVLGISKLQRLTNYLGNRFWLQEELTYRLQETIAKAAEVSLDDVRVKIVAQHTCETTRGVKSYGDSDFTTEV